MLNIQPEEYFYSLGDTVYKKKLLKQAEAKIKLFFSKSLSILFRENFVLTINRKTINAEEVVKVGLEILKQQKQPWFSIFTLLIYMNLRLHQEFLNYLN